MESLDIRKEDQILMSLVHFFVTKENYSPIYVHGVKDEIWLEKIDGPYRVIRINSNRIHNNEQFNYDQLKIKGVLKQVKKKTMSLNVNALNINLNEADRVDIKNVKNIDNINIKSLVDVETNRNLLEVFPNLKDGLIRDTNGVELIFNVTQDINAKTERENKKYERIFARKKSYITYIIMGICVLLFGISLCFKNFTYGLILLGANEGSLVKHGEVFRLITYAFLHGSLVHLLCNVYSLFIVGKEIESKFGKWRFILIYLGSAIAGGLLSCSFNGGISIGASGAIFGLLGALAYFGFKFRLYLKESLVREIVPVIIINLFIGFIVSGIDNACHIGGLIAGFLIAKAVGIPEISKKEEHTNGIIMTIIFFAFLIYLVFFR